MSSNNFHNSVEKYIGRQALIELTFDHLKNEAEETRPRSVILGERIKGLVKRGFLITEQDKIEFAEYILEYHVDFSKIAQQYLDEFKSLTKGE